MKDEIVVKRYADAFVKFSEETIGIQQAAQELKALKNIVIHDNPDFLVLLGNMEITVSEKCDFIDKVLSEGFSEETRQFLKLLIRKGPQRNKSYRRRFDHDYTMAFSSFGSNNYFMA